MCTCAYGLPGVYTQNQNPKPKTKTRNPACSNTSASRRSALRRGSWTELCMEMVGVYLHDTQALQCGGTLNRKNRALQRVLKGSRDDL